MKKAVITGATGMIGITLINYLLEKNISVLAIIRENSSNKLKLPQNKNLKIVECNLNNLNNLDVEECEQSPDNIIFTQQISSTVKKMQLLQCDLYMLIYPSF